jgi:flagellum-specific peptidoglycan hydrolase FlgJ
VGKGLFFYPGHTTQEEAMPYTRNHVSKEPKSFKKKKTRTEQLQNVISLRINDNERKTLEKLTKSTSKSISEIMREAIDLWRSKRRKLCMD